MGNVESAEMKNMENPVICNKVESVEKCGKE